MNIKDDKFNEKLNMDDATDEKIRDTNEKLVDYLNDSGEKVAAKQVQYLRDNQKPKSKKKEKSNGISKKLLRVNKDILNVLEKIHADMFDEQDTSIKPVVKTSNAINLVDRRSGDNELVQKQGSGSGLVGLVSGALKTLGLGALLAGGSAAAGAGTSAVKKISELKSKTSAEKRAKANVKSKTNVKEKIKTKSSRFKTKSSRFKTKSSRFKTKSSRFKMPKSASEVLKSNITKRVGGKLGKTALRGGAKILGSAAKFLGPVGLAVTAGMSVYDAVQGYRNAGEVFDKNDADLTATQKGSSAAGSLVSGLTFGLADSKDTAHGINNLLGGNAVIEKYEKLGIIDHDTIGDSEIEDWTKLKKLTMKEIQEIISIDDWDKKDLKKLKGAEYGAKIRELYSGDPTKRKAHPEESKNIKKVNYTIKKPLVTATGESHSSVDDYDIKDLFTLNDVKDISVKHLDKNVLSNLKAMAAEYFDIYGKKIQINSAYRSYDEQKSMKQKYGSKAASPGMSMHNYGLAIDMNTSNATNAINSGLFKKYGFTRPVAGETWHVEPAGINRRAIREAGIKSYSDYSPSKAETTPSIESAETETVPNENKVLKISSIGDTKKLSEQGDVTAKLDKSNRESTVDSTTNNLLQQKVIYETKTNTVNNSSDTVNNSSLPSNINNIHTAPSDSRLLNSFS